MHNGLSSWQLHLKVAWGQGEIISPCGLSGRSPDFWRAFTQANLRSKLAQRATICAPQGHALGGRQPDMHHVAWITMRKKFKCDCPGLLHTTT